MNEGHIDTYDNNWNSNMCANKSRGHRHTHIIGANIICYKVNKNRNRR